MLAPAVASAAAGRPPARALARALATSMGSPRSVSSGWAMAVHVYVSEGRDKQLVSRFSAAGVSGGAVLANEFMDAAYHRSGITLAAASAGPLEAGVLAVASEALSALDLQSHSATHPRVGVVDHVACNPLGSATRADAGALAARLGQLLGAGAAEVPAAGVAGPSPARPPLPVYLYGAARADERPLAELRRALGYFGGAARGEWTGLSSKMARAMAELPPDHGPATPSARSGAAVVGAVPWVFNYNLLLSAASAGGVGDDGELMRRARRVARAVSARGGGLAAVESMALPHERGVEVACNLLDVATTSPAEVRALVEALSKPEGLAIDSDYFTNKHPEDVLALVLTGSEKVA
ncbi:unnamed protein product [Prorocentrum cordatum]|uniref:Formiminotransferase N-terminal subdomain domain-containing protein n=1 Tax=Prorocentrum cordatum TaxID=2364126 RepID=A0ABN9PYA2_9DINO|nr:unnamed protein product [Polarella glacialis]